MRIRDVYCGVGGILMVYASSCDGSPGKPVHFVIPNGYRGILNIRMDPECDRLAGGTEPRVVIEFDEKGVACRSKDAGIFESWHRLTAAFKNGEAMPVNEEVDGMKVGVFILSMESENDDDTRGRLIILVGTRAERESYFALRPDRRQRDPGPMR